jgi:hypothetical protein
MPLASSNSPVSTVAHIRAAIEQLAAIDHRSATWMAAVLTRFLAGEAFEDAAGLRPGWRALLQRHGRDAALSALLAAHPRIDASALVAGIERVSRVRRGVRPDDLLGLFWDLAHTTDRLTERHWRRVLSAARGHRGAGDVRASVGPSATEEVDDGTPTNPE